MDDGTVAALEDELAALTARVTALEQAGPRGSRNAATTPIADEEKFWALTGLTERRGDHPTTVEGAVMLVGSLTLPGGEPVAWQQTAGTEGILDVPWAEYAETFSALAHPVRIELLRHILAGTHATADLARIETVGTTGQLHHHLRQLLTAGWVRQSGRGSYEVPAARVVPLLACLTGARR